MDLARLKRDIERLQKVQVRLKDEFGIIDIYSNSKLYEIMIANELGHTPIAGHSGTRNGKTAEGEFEYKHYKERSSNHSWTFNDYSDTVIEKLKGVKSVLFTHIDDTDPSNPKFDWYIEVSGSTCSAYLKHRTETLLQRQPKGKPNARRMINFSPTQLMRDLHVGKTKVNPVGSKGRFIRPLTELNEIVRSVEDNTGVKQILTSNKLWELIVSIPLRHQVLSEQSGHDATDSDGNFYEYKVATGRNWNFQDISENVLKKYESDREMILAVVDKKNIRVVEINIADSKDVIFRLRTKLEEKKTSYRKRGKELRRLSVSLSVGDLEMINARKFAVGSQ